MVDLYNESVAKGAGDGGKGGQSVDTAMLHIYKPVLDRARARVVLALRHCRDRASLADTREYAPAHPPEQRLSPRVH